MGECRMVELAISQLIKIILGVLVVVVVISGLYLFFKGSVLGFFENLPSAEREDLVNEEPVKESLTKPLKVCEDCGEGLINFCNKRKCSSLGNCKYSWWNKVNPCVTIK